MNSFSFYPYPAFNSGFLKLRQNWCLTRDYFCNDQINVLLHSYHVYTKCNYNLIADQLKFKTCNFDNFQYTAQIKKVLKNTLKILSNVLKYTTCSP